MLAMHGIYVCSSTYLTATCYSIVVHDDGRLTRRTLILVPLALLLKVSLFCVEP